MEKQPFHVAASRTVDSLTLSVFGELDFANAHEMDEILLEHLNVPTHHLILDFQGVSFLDSEGLKVLVRAYHQIGEGGGTISITGCSKTIGQLFDILGLRGTFGVETSGS
jgi:stage II sporulation protein AA (anti-sigma F factor antagonist)